MIQVLFNKNNIKDITQYLINYNLYLPTQSDKENGIEYIIESRNIFYKIKNNDTIFIDVNAIVNIVSNSEFDVFYVSVQETTETIYEVNAFSAEDAVNIISNKLKNNTLNDLEIIKSPNKYINVTDVIL